ncbi:DNA polymerase delta catalytic subunit, putative [Babesia caballi]|uniref:DNA polymerase n=1 Tax=Babesia caballi TaxID=5871 RepID=A0AAV4LX65_BABCB|nr:DNA polymerase delta catalytic subunit, putative [Babesia caballi]
MEPETQYQDPAPVPDVQTPDDTGHGAFFRSFARPPIDMSSLGDITIFQTDADYTTRFERVCAGDNGAAADQQGSGARFAEMPVVRLYGVTRDRHSVLVNVHNFLPYFYVEKPKNFGEEHIPLLIDFLNKYLMDQPPFKKTCRFVMGVSIVRIKPLMTYKPNNERDFLKITTALPRMVSTLRGYIESGIALPVLDHSGTGAAMRIAFPRQVCEANLPYVLRYLLDSNITGGCWLRLPAGSYEVERTRSSHCSLEVTTDCKSIVPMPLEGEWQAVGPIRMLSFDIECVKFTGPGFPSATTDPVIQIASVLHTHGDDLDSTQKFVFTLKQCDPLHGAHVLCFEEEADLLSAWKQFFTAVDPDFLTGYNIVNFDIPYLINRAKALNLEHFTQLPRIARIRTSVRDVIQSNNALGTFENKEINVEGRILFDVYDLVRRDHKLKSYTLNYVSFEFLKQQKEDVHHSTLSKLQLGSPADRRRIASYCLKDSVLPLLLIDKLLLLYNYVEMARVTSTPIKMLISRGQQIRVTMQIYRQCKAMGYAVPVVNGSQRAAANDATYEGGTVLDPQKGYHRNPIAVLDFQSLYPSIMIAHNLCYSTLVPPADVPHYRPEDLTTVPGHPGLCFIKAHVRKGVLPLIVEKLIEARKKAKDEMKTCTNPMLRSVLDGRQLALKVTTNSVYGYTGASSGGFLPCVEVATAITSFGRFMIVNTKETIERHFTTANGYDMDAKVVYGDTDSVMINFGTKEIQRAIELGTEAAAKITREAVRPITLVFEKVYLPLLLLAKKRYAGLYYTNAHTYDKIDCKGIETVRRDFCPLVQQMMERILRMLLVDLDLNGAIEFVKSKISQLLRNEIDISLLVVTKSLGKVDYDVRLPHVELAKKLRSRDPGKAPSVGDRVSYLIVKGTKGQPQFDRAEEPLYVVEHNIPVDTQHYLDAIKSTLMRIFEVIMPNPESLFSGEHTRYITMSSSCDSALSMFMKKVERCLGCKSVIKVPPFCDHCSKTKRQQVMLQKLEERRQKEADYFELWAQCQRCQGSLHNVVICDNRDCPIFYKRVALQVDGDGNGKLGEAGVERYEADVVGQHQRHVAVEHAPNHDVVRVVEQLARSAGLDTAHLVNVLGAQLLKQVEDAGGDGDEALQAVCQLVLSRDHVQNEGHVSDLRQFGLHGGSDDRHERDDAVAARVLLRSPRALLLVVGREPLPANVDAEVANALEDEGVEVRRGRLVVELSEAVLAELEEAEVAQSAVDAGGGDLGAVASVEEEVEAAVAEGLGLLRREPLDLEAGGRRLGD